MGVGRTWHVCKMVRVCMDKMLDGKACVCSPITFSIQCVYIHVSYPGPGFFFFSRAAGCFDVSHRPKSRERSEDLTETAETAHEKSLAPRVIYSIYSIFKTTIKSHCSDFKTLNLASPQFILYSFNFWSSVEGCITAHNFGLR